MKNSAEKFSITLNPEIASYLKKKARILKAPVSNVIAFALLSQKKRESNAKRKERLIRAYKQISQSYDSSEFLDFENAQMGLAKDLD